MKYRDLIQFEPIESVIQLQEADVKEKAAHLVRTYVISDRMADQLVNLVFEQVQLDRPVDNRGVLIVGNYGTGKSHLMAVISALAEHGDLPEEVRNPQVREQAVQIAGRFKVLRTEIGGVEKSLRDIVLDELEMFLEDLGIPYRFPSASQVANNKDVLIEVMGLFAERYPRQGLLFVLDELLDYLRTREERALIMDLGFLREVGEVVKLTPFRFVAGVQETLFDNPRFEFVAEQLRRVRDRFEQVRIAREDIAYVVSQRLLRKNNEQKARITEHLQGFAHLYPPLAERMTEFADLFPIHPAYIETFERVYLAEKREVLKTYSQAIRAVLDQDVPADQPGLISYDQYWTVLKENPSLRTLPGVAKVVEASNVLEGQVRNAYTRPHLLPIALRIVDALSVHRLTTSDIHSPIGLTVPELRDSLFLWTSMPDAVADAEFLAGNIQTALREIMRTVSGQFISHNDSNGQYFLDPAKVVDFDAQIAERGEFMSESDLNRFFFDGLRQLLGLPSSVYVSGYKIWEYELPWVERNVTRPGYLFFGAPDERSTAQPPRDFYVYILPPFDRPGLKAPSEYEPVADEVMLSLHGLGSDFEEIVRRYAGARTLATTASEHRQAYGDKADGHLRQLMSWLRENLVNQLQITHRGITNTVSQVLAQTRSSSSRDPEELLQVLSAHLLASHFSDTYADYPRFSRLSRVITEAARPASATDAIRYIALGTRTNLAAGVLTGLQLLDDEENLRPLNSPYAQHFLTKLKDKPENQVVNQGEVITQVAGGLHPIYKDHRFNLEPEWVAVILVALVYDGQITLSLSGSTTLDAGSVDRAATTAIAELADFRHFGRPKDLPLPVWKSIFDGLGLQSGLLHNEGTRQAAVQELQAKVQAELQQTVTWQSQVEHGISLWNESLFTDQLDYSTQGGYVVDHAELPRASLARTDLLPDLRKTKEFLEQLFRFNTPGKLRNLQLDEAEVGSYLHHRRAALRTQDILELVAQFQPSTAYLSEAQANLLPDHEWAVETQTAKGELLNSLRYTARGEGSLDLMAWQRRLEKLRSEYVTVYADLHRRHVLGPAEDDRRVRIMQDSRVEHLKTLADIDILSSAELEGWKDAITRLRTCRQFHEGLLADSPTCPACRFRPQEANGQTSAVQRLDYLEDRLDIMLTQWHAALSENLRSETALQSIAAMTPQERQPLDIYLNMEDPTAHQLPAGLVPTANQALRGIETVSLTTEELMAALKQGGLPCKLEELVQRFSTYLQQAMTGHDRRNTRLMLEE